LQEKPVLIWLFIMTYTEYENKKGLKYIDDLKERIDNQHLLNENE